MPVFLSCDTSCERVFLPDTVAAHSKTAQTMLREKKLNGAILTIELKGIAVETLRLFVANEGIANASRKTLMDVMGSAKSLDMQNIIDKVAATIAARVKEEGVQWLELNRDMTDEECGKVEKELAWLK